MASHARGRSGSVERTRRLLALLPHLHKGDTLSLEWLASVVGTTPDTVADDLWTLMMCGVPPFDPGDLIDLAIDEETVSVIAEPPGLNNPVRFTHAECRALAAALQEAGYPPDSPLLSKLLEAAAPSVSAEEVRRTLLAGTACWGGRDGSCGGMSPGDIYGVLAEAAESCEKVRVVYHTGATGRTSERVIHPWQLTNRHGTCYVTAFCESAGEERTFRLDRIREATLTDGRFECSERPRHTSGGVTGVVPEISALPVATVCLEPGASLPDEHDWPGMEVVSTAGSTVVRVPYQGAQWLARRVMAYLGEAEVIAPQEVRAVVRDIAEATLHEIEG